MVAMTMLNVLKINADVSYDYNSTTHTLTISGTGDMTDYNTSAETPWYNYKDNITTVVVKPGVTRIGSNTFTQFPKLAYIALPNGLKSIGDNAFGETAVEQLVIPASVETIGMSAFIWCDKLRTIYLGGNITRLGAVGTQDQDYGAFAYCDAVSDIYFYQMDIASIAWNNTWEFKENAGTEVHVYESASLPTNLNCNFVSDIGDDMRGIGEGDMNDPDNPYEISKEWQLDFITAIINSSMVNSDNTYFKLTADLEYDGTENNFTPLGTEDYSFAGSFDGDGHTISGININTDRNYSAVFPYIDNGALKNIRFDNIKITTTGTFAGIVGGATDATLENITVENSSFQADNGVGALVGMTEGGNTIRNCHVKNNVSVKATSVDNIDSNAGGLIGRSNDVTGIVAGCSSAATVEGHGNFAAGLIANNKGNITDCLYLGTSVSSDNNNSYAISGNWGSSASVNNCYYTTIDISDEYGKKSYPLTLGEGVALTDVAINTYGTETFPGITSYSDKLFYDGKYYVQASTTLTFADANTWYKVNGELVKSNVIQMPATETTVELYSLDGKGTAELPYLIKTTDDMDLFAKAVRDGHSYVGEYVELAADLVYDGTENNYIPVGDRVSSSDWRLFEGTFDGKGHSISGVYVKKTGSTSVNTSCYSGIFAVTGPNAVIKNLVCDNSTFSGHYTGGIVGYNRGIIENCRVTSTVRILAGWEEYSVYNQRWDGNDYMGGIVGYQPASYNTYGSGLALIRGCVSAAYVDNNGKHGCRYFGGIVGQNYRGSTNVINCLYLGDHVNVGTDLGGSSQGAISGSAYHTTGYVPNSYFTSSDLSDEIFNQAYNLYLSDDVAIVGEKTVYGEGDYEGITAYSNGVLYYDGNYYAPQGCETTFESTLEDESKVPIGLNVFPYMSADLGGATTSGMTLTMGTSNLVVMINYRSGITSDNWIYHRSESFSNISEDDKLLVINNEAELARFAYEVNVLGNTFEGWTVQLADGKDFSMSAHRWEPVGSVVGMKDKVFAGVFDGNHRVIRGLNASINDSSEEDYKTNSIGLFSVLADDAVVKDMFIMNATITGTENVGVVAGENHGTVSNCHVLTSTVTASAEMPHNLGGVVGSNYGGTVNGCSVKGTTISDGTGYENASDFGGICGTNTTLANTTIDIQSGTTSLVVKTATMENNIFFGDIHVSGTEPLGYFGAIAGSNRAGQDRNDNEYPAVATNNYYDASATVVVDNEVPPTYYDDTTHPYDTTAGLGIGQTSPNGNLGYTSADEAGKAEPLAVDGRDNTTALTLLAARNNYFDRPNESLLYYASHPFTIKGRTIYRNKAWNTICLPFDMTMTYSSPFRQSDVYELKSTSYDEDTQTLTINFDDPQGFEVKAGIPYIWRTWNDEAALVDPVFNDVTVLSAETHSLTTDFITFNGTYSPVVFEQGTADRSILLMGAGSTLYYPDGSTQAYVNAFRSYFKLADELVDDSETEGSVKSVAINFGDEFSTTGLIQIDADGVIDINSNEGWYDLSGRRYDSKPTTSGVYIHGGKKVLIK